MRPKSFLTQLASAAVWLVALGWAANGIVAAADGSSPDLVLLGVSIVLVVLGDVLEVDLRGGRSTPVSTAVVFALFAILPTTELVIVIVFAFFLAMIVRSRDLGWGPRFRSTSRRLGTTLLARTVFLLFAAALPPLPSGRGELLGRTLTMAAAGAFYLVVDTGLSALLIATAQKIPFPPIWKSQLHNLAAVHGAFLSVAVLIGLAFDVLHEWAFAFFLLPLIAARHAFRRYASIHRTYQQTIRALAKVPELAGYSREGHSAAVADLAATVARHLGLSDNEVQDIEFAALLHDVGRVSFADPADAQELGRPASHAVAAASASIVARTRYLDRVALVIRDQEISFSESPPTLGSRILKVANDYVEMTEAGGPQMTPLAAIHRMESEAGPLYDPSVVRSLRRVLENRSIV